ncbi:hypothetical protein SDC9_139002 [bioreactor metagenome]|uniref:Uncharacterized protein n=1 Tax=bioreactor metagenome TaxID=1076179 RepID=A0A645DRW5_9ZZZZ
MALAGDHEVIVAIQPQLHRTPRFLRGNGGPHGQVAGLRFLAAKATAHAPTFHAHGVVRQSQSMRDPVLHLTRMLGAGVDPPLLLLQRQHVGDLAFQIEMFLPANLEAALQAVRGLRQGSGGIATAHVDRRQHVAFGLERVLHAQDGGQRCDLRLHGTRGAACLHDAVGHHQADHLAHKLHAVDGEDRLVMRERGKCLVAWYVFGEHHVAHAGHCQRGAGIYAVQSAVCRVRENGRSVERALDLGDVVHVGDGARYLCTRAFVRVRCTHGRARGAVEFGITGVHGDTSSGCRVANVARPDAGVDVSTQKRCSSAPSTSLR